MLEINDTICNWVWAKASELILRRVGYCANLAVLDTHVVDYIKLANGTDIKPNFYRD